MMRLLTIEWLKIKSWRMFWILIAAYSGIIFMTVRAAAKSAETIGKNLPLDINFFSFPDVWHYVTFAAGILNFLLAAIMIFYVCNEYRNHTLRKQVVDGLSEAEFLVSKIIVVFGLTILSTFIIVAMGLLFGAKPAGSDSSVYWQESHYLAKHFLTAATFMSLATLFAIVVKRAVPAIFIFIAYFFVETIIVNRTGTSFIELLPLRAMDDLIPTPLLEGRISKAPANSMIVIGCAVACYFVLANILSWLKLKRSSF